MAYFPNKKIFVSYPPKAKMNRMENMENTIHIRVNTNPIGKWYLGETNH